MKEMRIRRLTREELQKAQDAAAVLACTDFNYYKFIMEREDQHVDIDLPALTSLADVPAITQVVSNKMLSGELLIPKAKAINEVLKQTSELNLEETIKKLEFVGTKRS